MERIFQGLVGEVKLALQVNVLPFNRRGTADEVRQGLQLGGGPVKELLIQVQAIPADDDVLQQAFASVRYLVFLLARRLNLAV